MKLSLPKAAVRVVTRAGCPALGWELTWKPQVLEKAWPNPRNTGC